MNPPQVRNVHMGVQPLTRLMARPSPSTLRLAHTRSLASALPKSGFQGRSPGFCQGCVALQMRGGFQTSAAATAEPAVEEAAGETHEYQAEVHFLIFYNPSPPPWGGSTFHFKGCCAGFRAQATRGGIHRALLSKDDSRNIECQIFTEEKWNEGSRYVGSRLLE
jgi:hypothetical protein